MNEPDGFRHFVASGSPGLVRSAYLLTDALGVRKGERPGRHLGRALLREVRPERANLR